MKLWSIAAFLLLVAVLPLMDCGSGSNQLSETNGIPASRFLHSGKRAIPVYDHFTDLAPLLQQQNDTTYIINFWATWCQPCVEELPYFERLRQETEGEKVKVVLISLDFERDLETKLIPFVEQNNLQSQVVVLLDGDYNSWIDKVDPAWGGAIPVTVLYNRRQRRFVGEQFPSFEALQTMVRGL